MGYTDSTRNAWHAGLPLAPVAVTALVEVNDWRDFLALDGEWNALVASTGDAVFHRHEFIRIWIERFAPAARVRILTLRDGSGRLVAALPLIEERSVMYGLPVRQLSSAANDHSNRFDLVAEDRAVAAARIIDHLARDPGWDVLRVTDIPAGGRAMGLYEAARQRGLPAGMWQAQRSPYLPLGDSFDASTRLVTAKFKANLRRRRKRLADHGAVTCRRVTDGDEVDAVLAAGLDLERRGWKGEAGTAIAQDAHTQAFYADLARAAAERGWLSLYSLELDGSMIAFQYGLTYRGSYLLLKVAYDESLSACSPGHLLVEDVLRDCVERDVREFDFLGPDMLWKRDWTDRVRAHQWVFVFRRNALGWALAGAKFLAVPAAKRLLARWRG